MSRRIQVYYLFFQVFILLCIGLETVKIRWQLSQEFENQEYLKVTINKLSEVNLHLQTEYYHLNSPAKIERHAKEELGMIHIILKEVITYEQ